MKSLNAIQADELAKLISELEDRSGAIDDAFNRLKAAHDSLCQAIALYNNSLRLAQNLRDAVVTEITDYANAQDDNWQDSQEAEAYQEWIGAWEGIDLDQIDLPDEPEEPEAMHMDELEDLPREVRPW
jgi:hypothetical protein